MWQLLFVLVLSLAFAGCGESLDVASSHFGTFDFAELERVQYDLEISGIRIPERDGDSTLEANELQLVSRHGQKYSCRLPERTETEAEGENGLDYKKLPNITELLRPLGCLTKTIGWWTYEYCHGRFIRQYHLEAGQLVGKTLYLGFFDSESPWDQEFTSKLKGVIDAVKGNVDGVPVAYHSAFYVNGTECDLTGKPRVGVARIYCRLGAGAGKLVDVEEKETCNYALTIQTPLVCPHPLLDPSPSIKPHLLSCTPLLPWEEYQKYLEEEELRKHQGEDKHKRVSSLQAEQQTPEKGSLGYESWLMQDILTKTFAKLLIEDDEVELTSEAAATDATGERGTKDVNTIPSSSKTGASGAQQTDASQAKADQGTVSSDSQDLNDDDDDLDVDEDDEDVDISQEELESAFAKIFLSLLNEVGKGLQQERSSKASLSNAIPQGVSDKFDTPESKGTTLGDGDGSVHSPAPDRFSERLSKLRGDKVTVAKVQVKSPFGDRRRTEDDSMRKESLTDKGLKTESPNLKETAGKTSSGLRQTVERRDKSKLSEESNDRPEAGYSAGEEEGAVDEEGVVDEQEWIEEALRELEQEVEDVLREELGEAEAEIKVKILSTSKSKDSSLVTSEQLPDDLDLDELHVHEGDTVTSAEITKTAKSLADSMTKLLEELLGEGDGPVSEERQKQQSLESSYNQVWKDREQRKRDKKPG